jgi:hypothetical protein
LEWTESIQKSQQYTELNVTTVALGSGTLSDRRWQLCCAGSGAMPCHPQ